VHGFICDDGTPKEVGVSFCGASGSRFVVA
jgi:hypothetical protein